VPVLTGKGIRRVHGDRVVLDGVDVGLDDGERVGLVGVNGAGKSTLARILAGAEAPDAGQVVPRGDATVAYLPQEPVFAEDRPARDVVIGALGAWTDAVRRHEEATDALARAADRGVGDGADAMDALVRDQERAAAAVERLGGWERTHEVDAVLARLGVHDPRVPVSRLSGGERRRVDLARVLVARPDLAILDEPTNHLDAETVEWLETYLADELPGALLLVTHDRYVLDRVAERTLEIDQGRVYAYPGGFRDYLEAKAARLAQEARAEANRQQFLKGELAWLRRQPKARTGKQKARVQRAEAALAETSTRRRTVGELEVLGVDSGKTILELRGVGLDVGGRPLVRALDLHLVEGERVGIVGPNGAGKTTLLRAMTGARPPDAGQVVRGKRTRFTVLEQTRSGLDPEATVLEAVGQGRQEVIVAGRTIDLHGWLERFLLSGPRAREQVGHLSGGERARVALARALLEPANVLLLDEPTNDLDVDTLAAVETMILESGMTTVVVTHDRYFLDRVATRILFLEGDGEVGIYAGGWSDAVVQRAARRKAARAETQAARARDRPRSAPALERDAGSAATSRRGLTYGERLELAELPARIEAAEADVAALEGRLADPATYTDAQGDEVADLVAQTERARDALAALFERWEALEERNDSG